MGSCAAAGKWRLSLQCPWCLAVPLTFTHHVVPVPHSPRMVAMPPWYPAVLWCNCHPVILCFCCHKTACGNTVILPFSGAPANQASSRCHCHPASLECRCRAVCGSHHATILWCYCNSCCPTVMTPFYGITAILSPCLPPQLLVVSLPSLPCHGGMITCHRPIQ